MTEQGNSANPLTPQATLDAYLRTGLYDPDLLWDDRFAEFLVDRQKRLLTVVERATGKPVTGSGRLGGRGRGRGRRGSIGTDAHPVSGLRYVFGPCPNDTRPALSVA